LAQPETCSVHETFKKDCSRDLLSFAHREAWEMPQLATNHNNPTKNPTTIKIVKKQPTKSICSEKHIYKCSSISVKAM